MRTYIVIDDGSEVKIETIETEESLRTLAKIGSLKIYSKGDIDKSIEKKVRILAYFGSQALHEIVEGRAQYAELILKRNRPRGVGIGNKLRRLIRI